MANVEWLFIDHTTRPTLAQGDLVSAEAGGLPVYRIMDITDARAWVRDARSERDHILPTGHLRWRMLPGA